MNIGDWVKRGRKALDEARRYYGRALPEDDGSTHDETVP